MNNLSRRKFGNMGESFKNVYIFDTIIRFLRILTYENIRCAKYHTQGSFHSITDNSNKIGNNLPNRRTRKIVVIWPHLNIALI